MAKKILLADDSLTIQKVVELTFSDSDYQLTSVSNGQRALDRVREERPDLILADVVMPEKNGYEVCEAIKGNPATAKIPVVLLSGTFEPFDRDRAERIGADAIVSKPFDSQQLLAQVEALLAKVPKESPAAAALSGATTAVLPMASVASDKTAPFEAGFTAEDFTGTVRLPPVPEPADPFEEEYGRAGVDSAIEAFETAQPGYAFGAEAEIEVDEESVPSSAQWLADEPEKAAPKPAAQPTSDAFDLWGAGNPASRVSPPSEATVALRGPLMRPVLQEVPAPPPTLNTSASSAETVVLRGPLEALILETGPPPPPRATGAAEAAPDRSQAQAQAQAHAQAHAQAPPRELEELASGTTIPELTQMLSTVARTNGELSDADIERLATKVVEKLSDKIVREIAWEVIPDMAEIVIKQRIKELESGVE